MANLRLLVKRRKAIRNIRKITRTMELIATARFKKAFDRASEAAAYTKKIAELAADLSQNAGGDMSHPLLAARPTVKKVLVLVITSNRGLCGGYNGGILREAQATLRKLAAAGTPVELDVSGRRGQTYFKFQRVDIANGYQQFEDKPTFEQVDELASRYADMFAAGQVDQVIVVYQKFLNAAKQMPMVETLLPMSSVSVETKEPVAVGSKVDYEFLPSAADILNELVPVAFKVRLFKCFLDAAVSEQIARRVAMKAATENAGDLIKAISQVYNRTRQANITKEISELIGGSEALELMATRRELRFNSLDEIIAEVDRLHAAGYEKTGQWDLAQVCNHCACWVKYPMDGFPPVPFFLKPVMWIMKKTMMPKFERQLREEKSMSRIPTAPASVHPPGQDEAQATENLKAALRRFEQYNGPIQPSPLLGMRSKQQWIDSHLVHCAHHLGFLVPKTT